MTPRTITNILDPYEIPGWFNFRSTFVSLTCIIEDDYAQLTKKIRSTQVCTSVYDILNRFLVETL